MHHGTKAYEKGPALAHCIPLPMTYIGVERNLRRMTHDSGA